jgi:hypothetical protein
VVKDRVVDLDFNVLKKRPAVIDLAYSDDWTLPRTTASLWTPDTRLREMLC